jgi:hypothetical protein
MESANAANDAASPLDRGIVSPANRYVVTWGDLGSNLLLGPAGGSTEVAQAAGPAVGVGACAAFSAWSTLVCKSPDPPIRTGTPQSSFGHPSRPAGTWEIPGTGKTVEVAGDRSALRPWLRFANGLPSWGELTQQLHVADKKTCAELADLLHAAAPETYED